MMYYLDATYWYLESGNAFLGLQRYTSMNRDDKLALKKPVLHHFGKIIDADAFGCFWYPELKAQRSQ